jgi:hypothetical protein
MQSLEGCKDPQLEAYFDQTQDTIFDRLNAAGKSWHIYYYDFPSSLLLDHQRRSLLTLTLAEREDISRGIASGSSMREIAKGLQRAVSTVSREVARHGGRPRRWNVIIEPAVFDSRPRARLSTRLLER